MSLFICTHINKNSDEHIFDTGRRILPNEKMKMIFYSVMQQQVSTCGTDKAKGCMISATVGTPDIYHMHAWCKYQLLNKDHPQPQIKY